MFVIGVFFGTKNVSVMELKKKNWKKKSKLTVKIKQETNLPWFLPAAGVRPSHEHHPVGVRGVPEHQGQGEGAHAEARAGLRAAARRSDRLHERRRTPACGREDAEGPDDRWWTRTRYGPCWRTGDGWTCAPRRTPTGTARTRGRSRRSLAANDAARHGTGRPVRCSPRKGEERKLDSIVLVVLLRSEVRSI